jgi:predicted outer membrane repeat protein
MKNNTATYGSGGGIYSGGTVNISGGFVSGNNAQESGGGIYAVTFKKSSSGGTVYGSDADLALRNTSGTGEGHAVYADTSPVKKRNLTVNASDTLDSGKMTGWE